jgi:hypothetical protein
MEQDEHERKILEELRALLFDPDGRTRKHVVGYLGNRAEVEELRLGAPRSEGAGEVIFLYRDLWRPQGLLGWRMPAWDACEKEPDIDATVLWANFMERIEASPAGLPRDRSPEGITWTL